MIFKTVASLLLFALAQSMRDLKASEVCLDASRLRHELAQFDVNTAAHRTKFSKELTKITCQLRAIQNRIKAVQKKRKAFTEWRDRKRRIIFTKLERANKECQSCSKPANKDRLLTHCRPSNQEKTRFKKYRDEDSEDSELSRSRSEQSNHNWAAQANTNAKLSSTAQAESKGKGESRAIAGPQGSTSFANGTKGTKTGTSFAGEVFSSNQKLNFKKQQGHFSDFAIVSNNHKNVEARGKTCSLGKGQSGSTSGFEGAETFAHGSKGTKTAASWKGDSKAEENTRVNNRYFKYN